MFAVPGECTSLSLKNVPTANCAREKGSDAVFTNARAKVAPRWLLGGARSRFIPVEQVNKDILEASSQSAPFFYFSQ
jgi:hypothetical protein